MILILPGSFKALGMQGYILEKESESKNMEFIYIR